MHYFLLRNPHWLLSTILFLGIPTFQAVAADNNPKSEQIQITVNINEASADEMSTLLKGVGLAKAKAIVKYRQANGPFKTKNDLTKVKGIGKSILKKNEQRILL
ncbi:helix-hairpin-helix domain-containing protein [Vibrio tritonius]|uniref:Helix-hairpin-helix domain-containing protein n=1 Tax=Vibrio tritonius TaxID=1435069 RepID=A0ABS7YPN9_9VIBR|nr:helix-hairpin-helix domain-containing protein [Vibrio tritonius]MCA2016224.1 helix-hairpin-helix domain-containing protein [Vibrio tritonius]